MMKAEVPDWIINNFDFTKYQLIEFAGRLGIALLILILGFKLINLILKGIEKIGEFSAVDDTLHSFIYSFIKTGLRVLLILITINELGVASSSIIALIGSFGLAFGLAIQGALKNMAGGIVLLLIKPFQIGDFIRDEGSGKEGTVLAINIMYTKLCSIDNSIISIPNGRLADSTVVNISKEKKRQVQIYIGIEYDADIKYVRKMIEQVLDEEEKCLSDDKYQIYVNEFRDSCIELGIRFWVMTEDYWEVKWRAMEKIKEQFDQTNIVIPYQKVDVTIVNKEG